LDFVKCRRLTNEVVAKGEVDQHCRMMDANRCREYARRCIEKANDAPDKEQSMLFDLAAAWLRLAADLDHNETPRDDVNGINVFRQAKLHRAPPARPVLVSRLSRSNA